MRNLRHEFHLRGNPAQNEAITHDTGPCLVLAGPGSGKTFVITERARYLIAKRGVPPAELLTLTFTRAAAGEMRRRFTRETSGRYPEAVFATFHSFFYSILRAYSDYQVRYDEAGAIDYDDMLTACHRLLTEDPALLARLRARYIYIQADEFQDVSPMQAELLELIAGRGGNLFCVGDDDQSIYAFRGADPDVMKRFVKTTQGVRVIRLNINYRCRKRIIGLGNALIRHNRHRFRKRLKAGRTEAEGEIALYVYETASKEIDDVLKRYYAVCAEGKSAAIIVRTNEEVARFYKRSGKRAKSALPNVMTLHAAKGLEFDTVFLPRLNEGILPVHNSGAKGRLEEERRLLYVGITRARMRVVMSCAHREDQNGIPSRFLREVQPYLRKHGDYAIFKGTFLSSQNMRRTQEIERFYDPERSTLSARLL